MITTIFSLLLSAAAAVATAGETVMIYQLDGSMRCQTAQATTPAEAAETLAAAGVKVISSDTKSVPFSLPGECGTPTGKANVLMVDAADWRALLKKRIDGLGFGEWIFDRPTVEVYKYDGSLQCKRGKEIALADMAEELTAAGVEVKSSRKGTDGLMHIAMCGASTGRLNVYTIATEALSKAQELGFKLLITRKMTNEIRPPLPARRGSAQPRTPPSEKTVNQIPRLW